MNRSVPSHKGDLKLHHASICFSAESGRNFAKPEVGLGPIGDIRDNERSRPLKRP
jgi:hypothetical protein